MRTVGIVIRAGRNQLDCVAPENGEVAIVLLPDRQVPGVVRMSLGPVTELMAAQGIPGRGGNVQMIVHRHAASLHVKLAQQSADAEQNAPRIVADDEDDWVELFSLDRNLIAFRTAGAAQ